MTVRQRWIVAAAAVILLAGTITVLADDTDDTDEDAAKAEHGEHAEGSLAALMERNRDHFEDIVRIALMQSLDEPLEAEDFRQLQRDASATAELAERVRKEFGEDEGEGFRELAGELASHAKQASSAAEQRQLPEVNVQVGEMGEYCAQCHLQYRFTGSADR
ncbi:MAG: hypothetical protein R6X25_07090 [Candidatus Krumholzibacteriia bacterium]